MGLVVLTASSCSSLVLAGVREAVMRAIPLDLRRAISVGIGLFIALIGVVNARLVVIPPRSLSTVSTNPLATVPPVTHGSLQVAGTAAGARRLPDHRVAALEAECPARSSLALRAATVAALLLGVSHWPAGAWLRVPQFDTVFQADVRSALDIRLLPLLLSLVMVDFFDTIGTVTAIAETGDAARSSRDGFRGCARFWPSTHSARRSAGRSA